jgi:hypothetical protein
MFKRYAPFNSPSFILPRVAGRKEVGAGTTGTI